MSAVAGVVTGTLCWGLAGWLGVSALFIAAPMAYVALRGYSLVRTLRDDEFAKKTSSIH
jgi:threonine/homoserine/homoserine lactone efflux protein